ncbi:MAG: hypothetical protein IJ326_06325 [Lachnospiraceae bacterium]|nr:hypothetical protein [Lachnospiraceae bacterium]
MKKVKDKEIIITGTMIGNACSLIGIICSIIFLALELTTTGDNITTWIVLLLCNISLYFSGKNNKSAQSQ